MSSVKSLFLGILLILLVGIGGLVYRNAVEHVNQPVACPLDAKVCPDGTSFAREGSACVFPTCPAPNVSLDAVGIAFALPSGWSPVTPDNPAVIAQYDHANQSMGSTTIDAALAPSNISILRYPIEASSTALATIQANTLGGPSGLPVPVTAYSSANIGQHHFTVVAIERFEGVVDTAYYLAREHDVLRFDAIDRGVPERTDSALDVSTLPAETALRQLLSTLQGQ